MSNSEFAEPVQPKEYSNDDVIPFAPDGDSPLIGGCVELVKGTAAKFKGMVCARKTVILREDANEDSIKRQLTREARALHYARHTHVIQLVHTYFDNRSNKIRFSIVMDRAEANLGDFLNPKAPGTKLPLLSWFGCLLAALKHIHTFGIRHRDIKPNNILIKNGQILLADFGISLMGLGKTMPTTNLNRNAGRAPDYCAPEVDLGRTRGRSADIFSLGAVFLEMCVVHSGSEHFWLLQNTINSQQHSSYAQNINLIHEWIRVFELKMEYNAWQRQVLQLCKQMLHSDRDLRPSAEDLNMPSQLPTCTCISIVPLSKDFKLMEACRNGSLDSVVELLRDGASPHTMSAIHLATERGSEIIVRTLLERGAGVDSLNQVNQTPLHCASRNGCLGIVELLLQNYASVNAKDENGQTALHGAAAHGHEAIVQILLRAGADTQARGLDNKRPYSLAKKRNRSTILQILDTWEETH